jgi:PAS domain-containing protein
MPWVEAISDPKELRRCIRDLVALSTLPAAWKTDDPRQIADSVAQTLLSMLRAEFVHIALPELRGEPVVELTRTREGTACASSSAIRDSLLACLPNRMLEPTAEIPNPLGKGTVRTASAPIGQAGDGFLVAGSRQPHFPTAAQRILLEMGGNQAAMFLDRWRAEAEGRRFAALVERSSDFISFASLDGGPRYLNPAGRKLVGLDDLDEPRRVLPWPSPTRCQQRQARQTGSSGYRRWMTRQ